MAQLLLIKDANTPFKMVGDIVGVFSDNHEFSDHEKEVFTIINVRGVTTEDMKTIMPWPKIKNVIRLAEGNKWVDTDQLEEKEVWQDPSDRKWRFAEPGTYKTILNVSTLTAPDLANLNSDSSLLEKKAILEKLRQRIGDNPLNTVECTDLNG